MKAIAALLFIALSACAAENGNPSAAQAPAEAAAPATQSPADPPPAAAPVEAPAPAFADPAPAPPVVAVDPVEHEVPKAVAGGAPGRVDTSCATSADCAVKDVGNCCGYFPACVNSNSPVFPEQVRAECEKEGRASICGFREITSCECIAGQCQAAGGGASAAQ